ncbi:hypothetical protein GCM10009414_22250 [Tatumella terrea]|mgnify:CR=1 FL=1|uniref:putative T6SS immunity periplasmic lipoprotein n=1 Tax=Tatumella terrea TaxID=419007 RepID=UPI0031D886A0
MKKYSYFLVMFIITGCGPGDRLVFRHPGEVRIVDQHLCIRSSPGDHLSYYSLSYSADQYQNPLAYEDNIDREFPDTCIVADLKKLQIIIFFISLTGLNIALILVSMRRVI